MQYPFSFNILSFQLNLLKSDQTMIYIVDTTTYRI